MHLNSIVAVSRPPGSEVRRVTVGADPSALAELVERIGGEEVWAAYEASSCGWEVHDELSKRGWKVWVLAPTHIAKSVKGWKRKNDAEDAQAILNVLMSHGELGTKLPAVWVPNARVRNDREVVRRRLAVAEKAARVKAEIRSLLRMHAVRKPEELKTTWSQKHLAWLKGLCGETRDLGQAVRRALASQIRELEFLEKEVEELQGDVEKLAEESPYEAPVKKMTEVSGVGILTAMTYLLELGDVHRFQNRRQIGSYLGLVPTSYESGEHQDRKGHISRMGPARIRKVLNQAAWCCVTRDPEWRSWYQELAKRKGAKKAIVAVMRKLGIELWRRATAA